MRIHVLQGKTGFLIIPVRLKISLFEVIKLFKISTTLLTLIMLTISGCAAFFKAPDKITPNVHIAFAHLIKTESFNEFNEMVGAKYQLDSIYKGKFLKNDYAYVVIKKETIPEEGLPEQAILVLHYFSELMSYDDAVRASDDLQRVYVPLENGAQKGILPDTPENRKKLKSLSLKYLSSKPKKGRITMEQAIEKAQKVCEEEDTCECEAERYPYGWEVYCKYKNVFSSGPIIYIGDDGKIKKVFPGL